MIKKYWNQYISHIKFFIKEDDCFCAEYIYIYIFVGFIVIIIIKIWILIYKTYNIKCKINKIYNGLGVLR